MGTIDINKLIAIAQKAKNVTEFEIKISLFTDIVTTMWDIYSSDLKKLKLYGVNVLTGSVNYKYLKQYRNTKHLEYNIEKVLLLLQTIQNIYNANQNDDDSLFIKNLHIYHYRLFDDISLDFKKGINILIGDNGVGKTSILDAIACCIYDVVREHKVTNKFISKEDIQLGEEWARIECTFSDGRNEYFSTKENIRNGSSNHPKQILEIYGGVKLSDTYKMSGDSYLTTERKIYPVICYQSVNKEEEKKEKQNNAIKDKRIKGYSGCLNGRADIKTVYSWLKTASDSEKSMFTEIIQDFICKLDNRPFNIKINPEGKIMIAFSGHEIALSKYSSGFQTIMQLIIDVSYRIILLNPSHPDPKKTPGVVLIDEIDLHLHPNWQWKIMDTLGQLFPNIQFIVTTHSPMILSSCKECNLILLGYDSNKGQIYHEEENTSELYGQSVDDVLNIHMVSSHIPEEIARDIQTLQYYFSSGKYEQAENTLQLMIEKYGEHNATVQEAQSILGIPLYDDIQ
jgi:predicted ATP-binding protein involved in virulence